MNFLATGGSPLQILLLTPRAIQKSREKTDIFTLAQLDAAFFSRRGRKPPKTLL